MSATSKKLVLIVEDDTTISDSITEFLVDNGFEVLRAMNGLEALALLRNQARPALILLDLMMPVMDGFKFREQQLAEPEISSIPVVIMSADGHVEEKKVRTAAAEYLRKPFDIFMLLRTVQKYTGETAS